MKPDLKKDKQSDNFDNVVVRKDTIEIRRNRPMTTGKLTMSLFIGLLVIGLSVWLFVWVGSVIRRRSHTYKIPLVLNSETCGSLEYNKASQTIVYNVAARRFNGFVIDNHSKCLEAFAPSGNWGSVCYILPMRTCLTIRDDNNEAGIPYFQSYGLHKFEVYRIHPINDPSFLGDVVSDKCQGRKVMWIQPLKGIRDQRTYSAFSKREEDLDVVEIFLI